MNRFNDDESSGEEEEVILLEDDFGNNITQEELIGYAQFLGFDIENDLEYLSIAHEALKKPLPDGWKRAYLKNSNRMCYIDLTNQQFYLYSPVDEEAINEYQQAKKQKEKKSTVVPKTKLMPIGESIQEKKKAKKITKDNLINNTNSDKNKENAQIKRYEVDKENDVKEGLKKNKEKSIQESLGKKNNTIGRKFIEDLEGFDQLNIPSPEIKKIPNENQIDKKEKETYYKDARNKLMIFEEELKMDLTKKKDEYESKDKKIRKKYEEENRQIIIKQSEELEIQFKSRIEDVEKELYDNNNNFILESNKINESKLKVKLEELDYTLKTLNNERTTLMEELSKPLVEEPKVDEDNQKLSSALFEQAKYLLEEKFQVELNTLGTKYKNNEREIEREIENEQNNDNKEKNKTNKDLNNNVLGEKLEEILNEYKKALEKEYEIYTNSLKSENDEKVSKEINKIRDKLDLEEAERSHEFVKETELIQSYFSKDVYFNQETSRAFEEKSAKIKENFDTSVEVNILLIENIEALKVKIKENLDTIIEELLSKIPDKNSLRDSFTTSKNFEDVLISINDEKVYIKKKNKLDLIELEYKEKSILFEYFIDIGKELIKIHRENSEIFGCNNNDDIAIKKDLNQKLFSLYREKVNHFINQLQKLKSTQIYNLKSKFIPDFSGSSQNIYSVRSSFEEKIKDIPYKLSKESFRYGENLTQFSMIPLLSNRFPKFYSKSPDLRQSKNQKENMYKDLELEIDQILLLENGSNKMNLPFNPNFKRKLSFEEILKKISNENLYLYRKIEKFINSNSKKIDSEYNEIDNEKKMQNNLKNALINSYRERSHSRASRDKPNQFYESVRILEDDHDRISVKKESIALKQASLNHIKSRFDEFILEFPTKLYDERKDNIDILFSKQINSLILEIEGFNKIYDKYFF